MAALAGPSTWQNLIRQRLEERDSREKSYDEIITNCESGVNDGQVDFADTAPQTNE